MIKITDFNKIYESDKAKEYREKISDLNFSLDYLAHRGQMITDELKKLNTEYDAYLKGEENEKKV